MSRKRQAKKKDREPVDKTKAADLIKAAVDRILDKVRQNMAGNINENTRSLLAQFSTALQRRLVEQAQVWTANRQDEAVPVLPDHTKYYTKVGNIAVVVLEYKPQVRPLVMCHGLINGYFDKHENADTGHGRPIPLALPYVILSLVFNNNVFQGLHVNYRNQPLKDLNDMLYHANLPNVNNTQPYNKVCLGQIFGDGTFGEWSRSKPIAWQTDRIVDAFWNSLFNLDYAAYYAEVAKRTPKMADLMTWHKSSITDPLFVLKVDWKKYGSLRDFVHSYTKGSDASAVLSVAFQREMESALQGITTSIQGMLKECTASLNNEKLVTASISEKLNEILDQALREVEEEKKKLRMEKEFMEDERAAIKKIYKKSGPLSDDPYENPWKRSW